MRAALCVGIASGTACTPAAAQGLQLDARGSVSAVGWQQVSADGSALQTRLEGHARHSTALAQSWQRNGVASLRLHDTPGACPQALCEQRPLLDGTLALGVSHYAYGNFLLGWQPSLLADLAQRSSAVASDMLGSDNCTALLAAPCPKTRPVSLSWTGLHVGRWTPGVQLAGGEGPFTINTSVEVDVSGGQLLAGFSWRDDGRRVLPLGLTVPLGGWRWVGLLTQERSAQGHGRYARLGASVWLAGGEWRAQARTLRQWRADGARVVNDMTGHRWTLGHYRPLNMHWSAYAGISWARTDAGQKASGADIGLRWVLR